MHDDKMKLAYLAGKDKALALWVNLTRDSILKRISEIDPSVSAMDRQSICLQLTSEIVNGIAQELKTRSTTTDELDDIRQIINLFTDDRSLISCTTEKCKNDFIETPSLKYIVNPGHQNVKISNFCPADGMTDNKKFFITDYYDMNPALAQQKLNEWYKYKQDLITKNFVNQKDKDKVITLFAELKQLKKEIKAEAEILYNEKTSSVAAKNKIKFYINESKKTGVPLQELVKNDKIAQIKYNLAFKAKKIKQIETNIDNVIATLGDQTKLAIEREADRFHASKIEEPGKEGLERYKEAFAEGGKEAVKNFQYDVILRKMAGNTPGFNSYVGLLEGRLNSLTLSGNKQTKTRNKLSEMLGLMCIYGGNITGDKELDKERFKVISKMIVRDRNNGETVQDYLKRLEEEETVNDRNEGLIKLVEVDPLTFKKKDLYGKNSPIETVHFSVPDISKYQGNTLEEQAKNALLSDGLLQMWPMLEHFGEQAFEDGVFVYDANTNKTIKAGNFDAIKSASAIQIINGKLNGERPKQWMTKYQQFVDKYPEKATELTDEQIQEKIANLAEEKKQSGWKDNSLFTEDKLRYDLYNEGDLVKKRPSITSIYSIKTPSASRPGSNNLNHQSLAQQDLNEASKILVHLDNNVEQEAVLTIITPLNIGNSAQTKYETQGNNTKLPQIKHFINTKPNVPNATSEDNTLPSFSSITVPRYMRTTTAFSNRALPEEKPDAKPPRTPRYLLTNQPSNNNTRGKEAPTPRPRTIKPNTQKTNFLTKQ